MVPRLCAFYQHIVYIYFHVPSYLSLEHFVHKPLVRCPCILQTEGHNFVVIQASIGDKRGLFLIFRVHEDLVVIGECIHEAEQFVTGCKVDQGINAWEGEAVLWTGFVEVGEVHAHFPLSVRLLYKDHFC